MKSEIKKTKNEVVKTKSRVKLQDKKVSLINIIGWVSVLALVGISFASGWKSSRSYDGWLDTQVKIQRLK